MLPLHGVKGYNDYCNDRFLDSCHIALVDCRHAGVCGMERHQVSHLSLCVFAYDVIVTSTTVAFVVSKLCVNFLCTGLTYKNVGNMHACAKSIIHCRFVLANFIL